MKKNTNEITPLVPKAWQRARRALFLKQAALLGLLFTMAGVFASVALRILFVK